MIQHLLPHEVFSFMLAFFRFGGFMIYMPTIGETYISKRIRIIFALTFSMMLSPIIAPITPPIPKTLDILIKIIMIELLIGLFIGTMLRILLQALSIAGTIIAYHIGFSNAALLNPMFSEQGSILSTFLVMIGIWIIYVTNLHYIMFAAAIHSYHIFPSGENPLIGDMANVITGVVAQSFLIGVHLATPFIVVLTAFYVIIGILSRLAPQVQIFFVSMPAQTLIGMLILSLIITSIFLYFFNQCSNMLANIFPTQ